MPPIFLKVRSSIIEGHHGSIGIALIIGNQPLGVLGLALQDRTEFSASEFEFFQALAQQAALAIHLTQLSEEVKQAAIVKERNRIVRDLHDSLAQSLTSLLVQLNVATQFFDTEPEETKASLIRAENLARIDRGTAVGLATV